MPKKQPAGESEPIDIITSVSSLSVPEGSEAEFNVRLSAPPRTTASINVARLSGDSDINVVNGSQLRFRKNDYNKWKTVTLGAAEDGDTVSGEAIIGLTGEGLSDVEVTAVEVDRRRSRGEVQIVTDGNRQRSECPWSYAAGMT